MSGLEVESYKKALCVLITDYPQNPNEILTMKGFPQQSYHGNLKYIYQSQLASQGGSSFNQPNQLLETVVYQDKLPSLKDLRPEPY
jgi:hypothetical protein